MDLSASAKLAGACPSLKTIPQERQAAASLRSDQRNAGFADCTTVLRRILPLGRQGTGERFPPAPIYVTECGSIGSA